MSADIDKSEAEAAIAAIRRICEGDDPIAAVHEIVDMVIGSDEFIVRLDLRPDHVNQKILAEVMYDKNLMNLEVLKLAIYAMKDFSEKFLLTNGAGNGTKH